MLKKAIIIGTDSGMYGSTNQIQVISLGNTLVAKLLCMEILTVTR